MHFSSKRNLMSLVSQPNTSSSRLGNFLGLVPPSSSQSHAGIFSAPAPVSAQASSSSSQSHAHALGLGFAPVASSSSQSHACKDVNNSFYVPNHPQSQMIGNWNAEGIVSGNENFVKRFEEEEVEKVNGAKVNDSKEDDDAFFNSLPPGFRFVPNDREVFYYLKKKIKNKPLPRNRIHDVNISHYNPEELAGMYTPFGDKTWYFFTPRDRKYANGTRPKRAAGNGFWKATGREKEVKHKSKVLGRKTTLVFYQGKPDNGKKTSWIMQEYRIGGPRQKTSADDMRLDDHVLCKIYNKNKLVEDSQQEQQQQQQQQDVAEEENKENRNDNNNNDNNYVQSQTVEDQGIRHNPTVNNTSVIAAMAADALPPVPLTTGLTMTTIIPSEVPPLTTVDSGQYTPPYTYQESLMMTVPNHLHQESPMMSMSDLYDESLCPNPTASHFCLAEILPKQTDR